MLRILLALAACASAAIELTGVELYSKQTVRYGRWEIRMKAAATPGTVSSFFTYYNDSYLGLPKPWREIDIEVLGNKPSQFQSNLITGDAASKNTSEDYHTIGADLSTTYHVYTLDWTPDSIVWRLDGKTMRKTAAPDQQVVDLRDSMQTYRMNLWASNSPGWVGKLDTLKLPVLQIVRWMRYSSYTPGQGDNGSDFSLAWADTFKTINSSRWALGNWTFDGNYATFSSVNAKVIDGHLVMMLSTVEKEGQFPASFPRDTAKTSSVIRRSAGTATRVERIADGIWRSLADDPRLEARDLRGRLLASSTRSPEGQILDLRGHENSVVLLRQGALTARMAPGSRGALLR